MKNHRLILDKFGAYTVFAPGSLRRPETPQQRQIAITPDQSGGLEILTDDWVLVTIPASVIHNLARAAIRNSTSKSVLGNGDGDGIVARVQGRRTPGDTLYPVVKMRRREQEG
jgi:hypothetical protein|tara:strand:- start:368 stop:706 length:339 start_codon:yes stop_codon:yes gene_type:complete